MHNAALRPCGLDDWRYLRAAAAAGAVRRDRAGAAGRRLPRRQRDDPAQGGGARARRRGDRRRAAIGAANTLTFEPTARILADNTDAPGLPGARCAACSTRGTTRARARRGRRRAGRGVGAARRPAPPRSRSGTARRSAPQALAAAARARRAVGAPATAEIVVNCTSVGLDDPRSSRSRRFRSGPMNWVPEACVVDMVYRTGETRLLEAARTRGARRDRRTGDPGRPRRCVVRTLDRPDGSPSGDAGGRQRHRQAMNPPAQTGAPHPSKPRQRASPRRRGVAAPAACSRTSSSTSASSTRGRWTTRSRRATGTAPRPSALLVADGRDHRRPARARGRGALRPRPRRPRHLPRRPRRRQARHPRRGQALPGRARSRSPATARCWSPWSTPPTCSPIDDIAVMTGYEVRPAVASLAGHRAAARAPRGPRLRQRRDRARRGRRTTTSTTPTPPRRPAPAGPAVRPRARTRRSTSAPPARTRRSSSSCTG